MNSIDILLLEDDPNLGAGLKEALTNNGYTLIWCRTAESAYDHSKNHHFRMYLFDVGLPDGNGFDLYEKLKQERGEVPAMFLTARGTPEDRIFGLELGADDYLTKPFHLKELLLRVKHLLSKHTISEKQWVDMGTAQVNFQAMILSVSGTQSVLTAKECALLQLLWAQRGKPVSRQDILDTVWSMDESPTPRTIDNFILRLRRWIEADGVSRILSVRGVGYMFIEKPECDEKYG